MGVFAIRRVAGPPQVLKAGGIVGELGEELGHRVVGGRRLRAAANRHNPHVVKLLDSLVKSLYNELGLGLLFALINRDLVRDDSKECTTES